MRTNSTIPIGCSTSDLRICTLSPPRPSTHPPTHLCNLSSAFFIPFSYLVLHVSYLFSCSHFLVCTCSKLHHFHFLLFLLLFDFFLFHSTTPFISSFFSSFTLSFCLSMSQYFNAGNRAFISFFENEYVKTLSRLYFLPPSPPGLLPLLSG